MQHNHTIDRKVKFLSTKNQFFVCNLYKSHIQQRILCVQDKQVPTETLLEWLYTWNQSRNEYKTGTEPADKSPHRSPRRNNKTGSCPCPPPKTFASRTSTPRYTTRTSPPW